VIALKGGQPLTGLRPRKISTARMVLVWSDATSQGHHMCCTMSSNVNYLYKPFISKSDTYFFHKTCTVLQNSTISIIENRPDVKRKPSDVNCQPFDINSQSSNINVNHLLSTINHLLLTGNHQISTLNQFISTVNHHIRHIRV
jgi:hypothetical protein